MTANRMMGGPMLGGNVDSVGLDPGIARTVAWLRGHGFTTTDSGDGKTKFAQGWTEDDGVIPYPHVAIVVADASTLAGEANRLAELLWDEHAIQVESTPPEPPDPPRIEASYCPASRNAMILLLHVDDSMLITDEHAPKDVPPMPPMPSVTFEL